MLLDIIGCSGKFLLDYTLGVRPQGGGVKIMVSYSERSPGEKKDSNQDLPVITLLHAQNFNKTAILYPKIRKANFMGLNKI